MSSYPHNLLVICGLGLFLSAGQCLAEGDNPLWNTGPLFDHFELTLTEGTRTESLLFLYSRQDRGNEEQTWALSPLMSGGRYPVVSGAEFDFLYPLFTYDRYGDEWRWQFFQIINSAGGDYIDETIRRRVTLFPFFFLQRSTVPEQNYTALWPLAGRLRNRLFYAEIDFILWPVLVKTRRVASVTSPAEEQFISPFFQWRQTRRVDVTTYNFIAPLFHWRTGPGLKGWQAWPLVHWEQKDITHRTNKWNDVEMIPGYRNLTILWPIFFSQTRKIGTPAKEEFRAVLPFYSSLRSDHRDSTSYLWPIGLTLTDDRARGYSEVGAPWPFIVFARGEGKTTSRVWPFYGNARNADLQSAFVLWPIYKYNAVFGEGFERNRSRILWFLFSHTVDKNEELNQRRRRIDFWPLFTHTHDYNGNTRLQILAPIEPLLPGNDSIERNYSPVWSIWRSEKNARTGAASQSLLWNLYRHESREAGRKCSLLFGLLQYQSDARGKRVRLFFIPVTKKGDRPDTEPESE